MWSNSNHVSSPVERDLPGTGFPGLGHDAEVAQDLRGRGSSRVSNISSSVTTTTTTSTSQSTSFPPWAALKATLLDLQPQDTLPEIRTQMSRDWPPLHLYYPYEEECFPIIIHLTQSALTAASQTHAKALFLTKVRWDPSECSLLEHTVQLVSLLSDLEIQGSVAIPDLIKASCLLRSLETCKVTPVQLLLTKARAHVYDFQEVQDSLNQIGNSHFPSLSARVSPDPPSPDSSVEIIESVRIHGEVTYVSSGEDTDEDEPSTPRTPATHLKLHPTSVLKPSNYPPPEVVLTGPINTHSTEEGDELEMEFLCQAWQPAVCNMPQHIQDHKDAGNLLRRKDLFFPDGLATEFLLTSIDQASVPDYTQGVADLRDNSCDFEQCAKYLNHLATTLLDNTSTVCCKFCGKLGHASRNCKFDPIDIPRITLFCQHCESTEHLTEDCPEDNSCPSCRVYGHIKYHCPDHLKSLKRKAVVDLPEIVRHSKVRRSMEPQCNS